MINANTNNILKYQIINNDRILYIIKFSKLGEEIELLITEKSSLSSTYKASLNVENFHEINKFFRQFDTIDEIFEYFNDLEDISNNTTIHIENKFARLNIKLPNISKSKTNNIFLIEIPKLELKENDLIVKICEQIKKIDMLETKIKFLFCYSGKNEKDFESFDNLLKICEKNINESNLEDSKIICKEDFILVLEGINRNLKKIIKNVNLLYRASRDGDNANVFHSKCDGKQNTVTFVKTKNGRKFGGFAHSAWNKTNSWISDNKVFIFSLNNYECYYYNNNGNMIYGCSSTGPYFGAGPDLCLTNNCLSNSYSISQTSFDYKGKSYALNGTSSNFQVEDYEVYELTLE